MSTRLLAVVVGAAALTAAFFPILACAGAKEGAAAYVAGDYATAFRESAQAAERGDPDAQFILGELYYDGNEVPQDFAKAVEWLKKAAEGGNTTAQAHLGYIFSQGQGVTKDYARAANWYRRAAEQGVEIAQIRLGIAYILGRGVPQDYVLGYAWLNIASVGGDEDTRKARDIAVSRMTPSQLEEAQKLSREYFQKYVVPFRKSQ